MDTHDDPQLRDRRTVDGRLIERVAVPPLAQALALDPHPEGGWYRRTWTAPDRLESPGGEASGDRAAATLILFLLPAGEASAWHRVTSDEVWIWSGGGTVQLQLGGSAEAPEPAAVAVLGEAAAGHAPQSVVPAHVWQRTLPAGHDALVSCVVSPGFDFADFTLHAD